MRRVYLSTVRFTDGKNVCIEFPYDERVIACVKRIAGRRWDPERRIWRCPLTSLLEVMEVLEPEGFCVSEELRGKIPEIKAQRTKQEQKWEAEELAEEQLRRRAEAGEEEAFVPASNSVLTRRLKACGAYEVIREKNYFGQQTAGLRVLETDLLGTLSEMGVATDPVSRFVELLRYAWLINVEAKAKRRRHSRWYQYMKKGYLLEELCRLATMQERFTWGWKKDPNPPANDAEWVLYFECDGIQCSFHTFERGNGPDFPNDWDGKRHLDFPFAKHLAKDRSPLFEVKRGKKSRQRH